MDYTRHLSSFLEKAEHDPAVCPTQISFYLALFRLWQEINFKNPLYVEKKEIMTASKISSKATYHKCLRILHSGGYIRYHPTSHPYKSSRIFMRFLNHTNQKTL